jgi:hypothetical protein
MIPNTIPSSAISGKRLQTIRIFYRPRWAPGIHRVWTGRVDRARIKLLHLVEARLLEVAARGAEKAAQ